MGRAFTDPGPVITNLGYSPNHPFHLLRKQVVQDRLNIPRFRLMLHTQQQCITQFAAPLLDADQYAGRAVVVQTAGYHPERVAVLADQTASNSIWLVSQPADHLL